MESTYCVEICTKCGFLVCRQAADGSICPICNSPLVFRRDISTAEFYAKWKSGEKEDLRKQLAGDNLNPTLVAKRISHEKDTHNRIYKVGKYTPKPQILCPYCKSTNTQKISGISRIASIGFFGLASGSIGKQFVCNSCHSKF